MYKQTLLLVELLAHHLLISHVDVLLEEEQILLVCIVRVWRGRDHSHVWTVGFLHRVGCTRLLTLGLVALD